MVTLLSHRKHLELDSKHSICDSYREEKTLRSLILCCVLTLLCCPSGFAQEVTELPRLTITRATSVIEVDGHLEEAAWADALRIPISYEHFPGENVEPPVATDCLLTFDGRNLYVAFRAHDPRPEEIRAHLMERDAIATFSKDDHVGIMLETFNDNRRAYQFRLNPLGVQLDGLWSDLNNQVDLAWNGLWEGAGQMTADGYTVEMAIPFNQLRFPIDPEGDLTWGFEAFRRYPREIGRRLHSRPVDRGNSCLLCQFHDIGGFADLEQGKNLEVSPRLTVSREDERAPGGTDLVQGSEDWDPGVDVRWGITSSLTLNATVNPTFSRVEADNAQLDVNTRFALFFPERRPFFLEGADLFNTPERVVFTRTIADPEWGLKLTRKEGKNAFGTFVARDRLNNLIFPDSQSSGFTSLDDEVSSAVVRYRRDLGKASTLGFLYAGREGSSDYSNHVFGVDGFFQLSPSNSFNFQWLGSSTRYPEAVARDFGQPSDTLDGSNFTARYNHQSRQWISSLLYQDRDEEFRADSGFVPRVGLRRAEFQLRRVFWGDKDDWYKDFRLGLWSEYVEDRDGNTIDEHVQLFTSVKANLHSFLRAGASTGESVFAGRTFDIEQQFLFFDFQPNGSSLYLFEIGTGDAIDFSAARPADRLLLRTGFEWKLGRHVNLLFDHTFEELELDQGRLFTANLSQLRAYYHFNVRSFVRGIFQYTDVDRTQLALTEDMEDLFAQILFSYQLNARTLLSVGYSESREAIAELNLDQTGRTFFVQLGYAFDL